MIYKVTVKHDRVKVRFARRYKMLMKKRNSTSSFRGSIIGIVITGHNLEPYITLRVTNSRRAGVIAFNLHSAEITDSQAANAAFQYALLLAFENCRKNIDCAS